MSEQQSAQQAPARARVTVKLREAPPSPEKQNKAQEQKPEKPNAES